MQDRQGEDGRGDHAGEVEPGAPEKFENLEDDVSDLKRHRAG
jgi:hypothetical protein